MRSSVFLGKKSRIKELSYINFWENRVNLKTELLALDGSWQLHNLESFIYSSVTFPSQSCIVAYTKQHNCDWLYSFEHYVLDVA